MQPHRLIPFAILATFFASVGSADEPIDFNRQIRPLLSKHCFRCHGQDEVHREAGLRLDQRNPAIKQLDSGGTPIVPGNVAASELVVRINSADDDLRMPPAETGVRLSDREIKTIALWIKQGAPYARHWSFIPPQHQRLPRVADLDWVRNPIDLFVLAELDRQQLEPSGEANRHALVRRLSLDLRGLPPTPGEVTEFVNDSAPDAYGRLVTRFLDDPAYGERWARLWLDLARYADSRGYGSDPLRPNMWRYRDWVIDAFNRNLPYDQFTIEQLAGDLLPNASIEQQMATAFHRNTMTNTEGGTDDEEFRVAAVKDRIETTIQVWMGLTMQCANCHDHKYDPIKQDEYYRLFAIFNQTTDTDLPSESPVIEVPTPQILAQHERVDNQVRELQERIEAAQPQVSAAQETAPPQPMKGRFVRIELPGQKKILSLAEVQVWHGDQNLAATGKATQSSTTLGGRPELAIDGNTDGHFEAKSTTHTNTEANPWWELDLGEEKTVERVAVWNRTDNNLQSRLQGFRIRLLSAAKETIWQQQIKQAPRPSSDLAVRPLTPIEKEIAQLEMEIVNLKKTRAAIPTLPVMQELALDKRRSTHLMVKGNFLDKGREVQPAVPVSFNVTDDSNPKNRLGAARWLTAPDNPLTSRVAVNRIWAQLFGIGLVETEEDFGTQGEPPSHPDLLDWLSTEFAAGGWDLKQTLRLFVTSATYRQSSRVRPKLLQRDPHNRLLARGPRFRLDAETLRDQALALSGLLCRKLNGPSVYPYQPKGLWRAAFNGQRTWPASKGDDRFRRGLYTFWRRTVPYPSMQTFDAPSREICTVRRIRTNTPLQAFVTLNDPVYVEAAQALARRIVREGGGNARDRADYALRLCLTRPVTEQQVSHLVALVESELVFYRQDAEAARQISADPLGPPSQGSDVAELAAWTVVANVLLNLDGVLTKG